MAGGGVRSRAHLTPEAGGDAEPRGGACLALRGRGCGSQGGAVSPGDTGSV